MSKYAQPEILADFFKDREDGYNVSSLYKRVWDLGYACSLYGAKLLRSINTQALDLCNFL